MSVPSTRTVVANLQAEGNHELANRVLEEARKWKCSGCRMHESNPGISLEDGPDGAVAQVVFYCRFCSDEVVRPDEVLVKKSLSG